MMVQERLLDTLLEPEPKTPRDQQEPVGTAYPQLGAVHDLEQDEVVGDHGIPAEVSMTPPPSSVSLPLDAQVAKPGETTTTEEAQMPRGTSIDERRDQSAGTPAVGGVQVVASMVDRVLQVRSLCWHPTVTLGA